MTRTKKVLLGVVMLVVAVHCWLVYFHIPNWEPVWTSTSPDGRFTVSVYSNSGLSIRLFNLPGNGASGQGTIVLRENKTGKALERVQIDLLSDDKSIVDWYPEYNEVLITSIGAWKLPQP